MQPSRQTAASYERRSGKGMRVIKEKKRRRAVVTIRSSPTSVSSSCARTNRSIKQSVTGRMKYRVRDEMEEGWHERGVRRREKNERIRDKREGRDNSNKNDSDDNLVARHQNTGKSARHHNPSKTRNLRGHPMVKNKSSTASNAQKQKTKKRQK